MVSLFLLLSVRLPLWLFLLPGSLPLWYGYADKISVCSIFAVIVIRQHRTLAREKQKETDSVRVRIITHAK